MNYCPDDLVNLIQSFQRRGYSIESFSSPVKTHGLLYLRHDIDFDPSAAETLANVEADHGMRATYFWLTSSPLYNLRHQVTRETIRKVADMGHETGLHIDVSSHEVKRLGLEEAIEKEIAILEDLVERAVSAFSFHRPATHGIPTMEDVRGVHNTYAERFTTQIAYFSDSTGQWRYGNPLTSQAFQEQRSMQLLLHPIWWTRFPGEGPQERLVRLEDSVRDQTRIHLKASVKGYEPET